MEQKSLTTTPIYHMLEVGTWHAAPERPYAAASLASEGFIHLSGDAATLLHVANSLYRNEPGEWSVLVVDPTRLQAPLRWEPVGDGIFPHLYGPLEREAVLAVVAFPRTADGRFLLPEGLQPPTLADAGASPA